MSDTLYRTVNTRFSEPLFPIPVDFAAEQHLIVGTHAGGVVVHEFFDDETKSIELGAGNKGLSVSMPTNILPEFYTLIETRRGRDRIFGATTALYTRADQLMQQATTMYGSAILYTLNTADPQMIAWANTHGAKIFEWERLSMSTQNSKMFGRKVYTP